MGSVKQPRRIHNILGIHVRVFYSLALICTLEVRCRHFFELVPGLHLPTLLDPDKIVSRSQVLLWSCCLFATQSSGAAQAYYTRETVRIEFSRPKRQMAR